MPRFSKIAAEYAKEASVNAEQKAAQDTQEVTYEVVASKTAMRMRPVKGAEVALVLKKGERVVGTLTEADGLPWLRVSRDSMEEHPLFEILDGESYYVLVDGKGSDRGLGMLLKRVPAELGWCPASDKKGSQDVYEVISSSAVVTKGRDLHSPEADVLLEGSLVKVLEVDEESGKMRFETVAGEGPEEGWVSMHQLQPVSQQLASEAGAATTTPKEVFTRPEQSEEKAAEALKGWAKAFWRKPEDDSKVVFNHESFDWRSKQEEKPKASVLGTRSEEEVRLELSKAISGMDAPKARGSGRCSKCCLPLSGVTYPDRVNFGGKVHAECLAQQVIQELKDEEDRRMDQDREKVRRRHKEYNIGWKPLEHIPLNYAPAARLTGLELPHGLFAVSLAVDNSITLVPTACPAAAVNLEYLSVALKVRLDEGREPLFSLDPVDPDLENTMQVKRFEPHWLKGTSVGDVLFESDYHLKELSFGAFDQPIVGMRSVFDFSDDEGWDEEWMAREWFVVRHAQVELSEDGVLIPNCKMGVEAREQKLQDGELQDVKCTRPNHPMVRYAETFTHNFDLIAERKSVIYHLRELAKASILAKYLVESDVELDRLWAEIHEQKEGPIVLEVPQLFHERGHGQVNVQDGRIVDRKTTGEQGVHMVYGGVQFGMDKFRLAPTAAGALQARTSFQPTRLGLANAGLGFARGGMPAPRFTGIAGPRLGGPLAGRMGMPTARMGMPTARLGMPSGAVQARKGFIPPSRGFVAPAAAISARPGFMGPSRLAAPSLGLGVQPRGVDLNLNKFSLTDTTTSSRKGSVASSEDLADAVTFGTGFWKQLDGSEPSSLGEQEKTLLKAIFNPSLSDRRGEGELFVPPDPLFSYGQRLKILLLEELAVRNKRREAFFSTDFVMGDAGPTFPWAWTCAFQIKQGSDAKKRAPEQVALKPRPEYKEEASQLRPALASATPIFDERTEDGLRFRIYRLGDIEVRTVQDLEGEEEVGAVFSIDGTAKVAKALAVSSPALDESEIIYQIKIYEESDPADPSKVHHYLVAETESGNFVVTEKLRDGTIAWEENPSNLAARNSSAKLLKTAEKKLGREPPKLGRLKLFRSSKTSDVTGPDRNRYVQGALSRFLDGGSMQLEGQDGFDALAAARQISALGVQRLGMPIVLA